MTGLVQLCLQCSRQADRHQSLSEGSPSHCSYIRKHRCCCSDRHSPEHTILNRNCPRHHPFWMARGFLDTSAAQPLGRQAQCRGWTRLHAVCLEDHHTYLEKLNLVKWTVFFIKRVKFSASARRGFLENNHQQNQILHSGQGRSQFPLPDSLFRDPRTLATMDSCNKCSCVKFSWLN